MKKFFKFAGSVAMLCAAVAGGIFAYKKFFAPETYEDDFDDDPEEAAEAESEGNDSEETIEKEPEV